MSIGVGIITCNRIDMYNKCRDSIHEDWYDELVTINDGDDSHLYHAVFSTAKHWDSTDMFAISIQSDTDITGNNERIFLTLVIEDDWSTYLGIANTSTTEIDTTP